MYGSTCLSLSYNWLKLITSSIFLRISSSSSVGESFSTTCSSSSEADSFSISGLSSFSTSELTLLFTSASFGVSSAFSTSSDLEQPTNKINVKIHNPIHLYAFICLLQQHLVIIFSKNTNLHFILNR